VTTTGTIVLVLLLLASLGVLVAVVVVCSRRVVRAVGAAEAAVGDVQHRLTSLDEVRAVTATERATLDRRLEALRAARDERRGRAGGRGAWPEGDPRAVR
jgi:hypothetical protein